MKLSGCVVSGLLAMTKSGVITQQFYTDSHNTVTLNILEHEWCRRITETMRMNQEEMIRSPALWQTKRNSTHSDTTTPHEYIQKWHVCDEVEGDWHLFLFNSMLQTRQIRLIVHDRCMKPQFYIVEKNYGCLYRRVIHDDNLHPEDIIVTLVGNGPGANWRLHSHKHDPRFLLKYQIPTHAPPEQSPDVFTANIISHIT